MTRRLAPSAALVFAAAAAQATGAATSIDALERGTLVTVEGTVARITDEDAFRLTDRTGTVRIYLGENWVPAVVGEAVRVQGFVGDTRGAMEISAQSLTRADGTIVTFERLHE